MDNFDKATILKLSKEPDSIKLDVIEKYAEKLGGYFIAILSKDMNENNRMKIIGEYADKLGSQRIAVLAQNMPDEYKLKIIDVGCIENKDIPLIIKGMSEENILKVITNIDLERDELVQIASEMSIESKLQIMKNGKIEGQDIVELTQGMSEDEKIKVIQLGVETQKLDGSNIATMVTSFEETKNKKDAIDIYHNFLSSDNLLKVIVSTKDSDYIKSCIDDNKLNLDGKMQQLLVLATNDIEFIRNNIPSFTDTKSFKLPPEMTIGMEIESEGSFSSVIMSGFDFAGWKATPDGSLDLGVEVVSPILHANENDVEQIYIVTNTLNSLEQNISEKCGGHIHIGADFLTSKQAYTNLLEIWCNTEKILYSICNDKNEAPRGGVGHYAKPISPKVQEALEMGSINLSDDYELDSFVEGLKQIQGLHEVTGDERYSGLNFLNINNGKNTIEFRLANGTINPDLWIDNINLFGGIVAISEELAQIQQKGIENDEDRSKIEMLGRLKEDISEEDKLKILLELVGVEPEAYMDRYESNMRLMDNEQERKEAFEKVKGPIDIIKKSQISSKDIAQATVSASALMEQEAISTMVKEMEHEKQQENVVERT